MNTCKRQMLSGPPAGTKTKTVCCVVCGARRLRTDPHCFSCYPVDAHSFVGETPFLKYKPEHGSWSGLPAGIISTDTVEVIFYCDHGDESPIQDRASNFGWNSCDIAMYRKVSN